MYAALQIHGPDDFARLAQTESDCSSARNGGDLGEFGPGQMMKSFVSAPAR
jgi:parvulin-like peptidyl-prolyl isomerase